jgi:cytidine deaminase
MNAPTSSTKMNRRTALAVLGSAGLGLAAMKLSADTAASRHETLRMLLPKFNEKSRELLAHLLDDPGFSGQISAADTIKLAKSEGKALDNLMLDLLPLAKDYSRRPVSNYPVGVVARGDSGSLFLGANIEIPGHSLGFSVHGEQSALSNLYMHAERGVSAIAVTAAPCGHCRQFMYEMSPDGKMLILVAGKPASKLSSLLPSAFGPKDLNSEGGTFPIKEVELALTKPSTDELTTASLKSARRSYAPYTKAHSGVAIATKAGRIFEGGYIENAAFNPSLSPLQTALGALIVAGEQYSAISRVTLVEVDGAPISQKAVTDAALGAIAPTVRLEVALARLRV